MPSLQNYQRHSKTHPPIKPPRPNWLFPFVLVASALFVWLTSQSMPEVVASHFVASGTANGFLPRHIYLRFILGLVVILPLLVAYLPGLTMNSPNARINIPNREYWLAPERRQNTIKHLCRSMQGAALLLTVFLTYVHWLVVKANTLSPPVLPPQAIIPAIVTLIILMLYWSWWLVKPFRQVPR